MTNYENYVEIAKILMENVAQLILLILKMNKKYN